MIPFLLSRLIRQLLVHFLLLSPLLQHLLVAFFLRTLDDYSRVWFFLWVAGGAVALPIHRYALKQTVKAWAERWELMLYNAYS